MLEEMVAQQPPSGGSRPVPIGSRVHRSESPTGYSSAGCSPAEPASASPVTDDNNSIPIRRLAVIPYRAGRARRQRGCDLYFARRVTFLPCADKIEIAPTERNSGHATASYKIRQSIFRQLEASRRVLCLSKCFERVTDKIMAIAKRNVRMPLRAVMVVGGVTHLRRAMPHIFSTRRLMRDSARIRVDLEIGRQIVGHSLQLHCGGRNQIVRTI
jgi:hypothetical protein